MRQSWEIHSTADTFRCLEDIKPQFFVNKTKQVLRQKAQQKHVEIENMLWIAQHQEV